MKAFALKKEMGYELSVTRTFIIEDDALNKVRILEKLKTLEIEDAREVYKKYLKLGYKRIPVNIKEIEQDINDARKEIMDEWEDISDEEFRRGFNPRPIREFWDDYWDFTLLDCETVSWELGKPAED